MAAIILIWLQMLALASNRLLHPAPFFRSVSRPRFKSFPTQPHFVFAYCHFRRSCHRFNTWSACWVLQRNKGEWRGMWRQILAIVYYSRNTSVCLLRHEDGRLVVEKECLVESMQSECDWCWVRLLLCPLFYVSSSSSSSSSSSFFSLFMFVFYFFMFIRVFTTIIILFLFLLLLPLFFFFQSSCSPYCYSCSSIFVDSFLADVDECTASSPVCGIHFNCINTLGSYRCEYNHSCQGKKSVHHVFIFVMAKLNTFGEKWNDKCGRSLSKCLSRNNKT